MTGYAGSVFLNPALAHPDILEDCLIPPQPGDFIRAEFSGGYDTRTLEFKTGGLKKPDRFLWHNYSIRVYNRSRHAIEFRRFPDEINGLVRFRSEEHTSELQSRRDLVC